MNFTDTLKLAFDAIWAHKLRSFLTLLGMIIGVTAFIVVLSFKQGQNDDGTSAFDWRRTGLPSWGRWVIVAALMAIPIWWVLIPH